MADPNSTFSYYPPNSNLQPQFTQPYAAPSPVSAPPPAYGGLQMPCANACSQSGVPEQVAINDSIPNAVLPIASPNLQQSQTWSNYSWGTNAFKRKMKPIETVRCEICDIFCNSIELYEKHVSGKKHLKTLKQKYALQTTPSQPASQLDVNSSMLEDRLAGKSHAVQEISNTTVSGSVKDGASSSAVHEGLDAKKQKLMEHGVAEESVLLCNSGNAVSTSVIASADHLAGEENTIQLATTSTTTGQHNNNIPSASPGEDIGTKKQKLIQCGVSKEAVRVCTICSVVCNSEVVFADHIVGKKHIAHAQKVAGVCNLNQSIPQAAKILPESIDSKKLKMLGSGTVATSIRECPLCDVVCNSDLVFKSHLSGQKHASMLKKMTPR